MKFGAKEVLIAIAAKNKGDWDKTYMDLRNKERPTDEEIEKFFPIVDQSITIIDEDYPKTWEHVDKSPLVLFYKGGRKSLINKVDMSSVFVLDDNKNPQTKKIISDLLDHDKLVVIPILDAGNIMIKYGKQTLVLSEYPYVGVSYDINSIEKRRRVAQIGAILCGKIFVGISKDTEVVRAAVSSALSNGRDIYVAPTRLGAAYENNKFIRDGASIALDWLDIAC